MMDWIKQGIEKVVPHLESQAQANEDVSEKTEDPASTKGSLSVASLSNCLDQVLTLKPITDKCLCFCKQLKLQHQNLLQPPYQPLTLRSKMMFHVGI